jgi:hypothetical protein
MVMIFLDTAGDMHVDKLDLVPTIAHPSGTGPVHTSMVAPTALLLYLAIVQTLRTVLGGLSQVEGLQESLIFIHPVGTDPAQTVSAQTA